MIGFMLSCYVSLFIVDFSVNELDVLLGVCMNVGVLMFSDMIWCVVVWFGIVYRMCDGIL